MPHKIKKWGGLELLSLEKKQFLLPDKYNLKKKFIPYMLLLPMLITIGTILIYPLFNGVWVSFHHKVLTEPGVGTPFVGLKNYIDVVTDDVFGKILKNTGVYIIEAVFFQFLLGFGVAFLLNQKFKCRGIIRGIVLLPWVAPGVVVAMIWAWLLNGTYGVINDILFKLGIISDYIPWLAQSSTALQSVIFARIWKGFPFFAIMILAGLQAIPKELYEAAEVDGTTTFQKFRWVTLPMLKQVITISILLRLIKSTNELTTLLVMTGGGPGNSSMILPLLAFTKAWKSLNFGYAAAIATMFMGGLLVLIAIYLRLQRSEITE